MPAIIRRKKHFRFRHLYASSRMCIPDLDSVPAKPHFREYTGFLGFWTGFRQDRLEYNHFGARLIHSRIRKNPNPAGIPREGPMKYVYHVPCVTNIQ